MKSYLLARSQDGTKDIPFVFYTAHYVSEKDRELAFKLGASRYIIKPKEPLDLLDDVASVLSEYQVGLIKPVQSLIGTQEAYLKEYNERLFQKLEDCGQARVAIRLAFVQLDPGLKTEALQDNVP